MTTFFCMSQDLKITITAENSFQLSLLQIIR